jgi:hypothetical protein
LPTLENSVGKIWCAHQPHKKYEKYIKKKLKVLVGFELVSKHF